jgi:hypothetical protein
MANAGNTVDAATINREIAQVANYILGMKAWLDRNSAEWLINGGNQTVLNAAGITDAGQVQQILNVVAILSTLQGTITQSWINQLCAVVGVS